MDEKKDKAIENLKAELLERCKGCCEKCGKTLSGVKGQLHHINNNPLDNSISNLIVVCPDCHLKIKKNEELQDFFENIEEYKKQYEYSPPRVIPKSDLEGKKQEEYILLNGMLFLIFALPAIFAVVVGLPMGFFYWMVIVWVHEAGHGFICLFGSGFICALGGFLNEMLVTVVPALICFRKKEIYIAGCILVMCAGMSIQNNGVYMQSAESPHGTSFAGALTGRYNDMTAQSHDWSRVFNTLGLIESSYDIGKFVEDVGHAIAVIFLTTAILSVIPMTYGWVPGKLTNLVGSGAIASAAYFILSSASGTEITLSIILSTPILYRATRRIL